MPAMKQPSILSTSEPSYFLPTSTPGSVSATLLTASNKGDDPAVDLLRFRSDGLGRRDTGGNHEEDDSAAYPADEAPSTNIRSSTRGHMQRIQSLHRYGGVTGSIQALLESLSPDGT
jgi:hypothetical protein